LALTIAVISWFVVSLQTREVLSLAPVDARLSYNIQNPQLIILDPPNTVRVNVRGPASKVGSLAPLQVSVRVDLRDAVKGKLEVQLGPKDVDLPEDLEVDSIEPNVLQLQIDVIVSAMKPIVARLTGEPSAGAIAQETEVRPTRAVVSGPESRIKSLAYLTTSEVNLNGHATDFEEQAFVVSTDPLIKVEQPPFVTVRVPLLIPGVDTGDSLEESP
jgi:YbbR domain-containing protein